MQIQSRADEVTGRITGILFLPDTFSDEKGLTVLGEALEKGIGVEIEVSVWGEPVISLTFGDKDDGP